MRLRATLFQLLPESLRHRLLRQRVRVSAITEPDIQFKLATTQDELERAFALLHDCYCRIGLMDPHPAGLRCTVYSASPYTTVLVAKRGDEVVGTVSLIKDSPLGFPSDKEYRPENEAYRCQGRRLVEVSALAVRPDHRRDHRISFHLMKYLRAYAYEFMGCDMLCATVHPRVQDFYTGLFGFRRNGAVVDYGFVKGAKAVHLTLDLLAHQRDIMPRLYGQAPPERNLCHFLYELAAPFTFPSRSKGCVVDPVMTPDMLRYFFVERTSLFDQLPRQELAFIRLAYEHNFDLSGLPELMVPTEYQRSFRFPMEIDGTLLSEGRGVVGKVRDLSVGGLYLETGETLATGLRAMIIFNVGDVHFRLPVIVRWCERGGYGLRFLATDLRLLNTLRSTHHNDTGKPAAA